MTHDLDYADVQGLVRFGYARMTRAYYALLRVKNLEAARAWLHFAPVSNAVKIEPPPTTALHVAFTALGLSALGVSESAIAGFSHEFRAGIAQESRSRQLGDVESNAPEDWDWGGPANEPHLVVMFFAEPDYFDAFVKSLTGAGWSEAFEEPRWLHTGNSDGFEPFGFADGISQPTIDWKQERDPTRPQLDYTNEVALGEFLLGYRNGYGKFTDRPLLPADAASAGLFAAVEEPGKKDLARMVRIS